MLRAHLSGLSAAALIAATCLIGDRATAQFVNPPTALTVEGPSRFGTPFSNSTSSSAILHEIHGLSAFPSLTGNIVQVAWRRDNDTAVASGNYVAFSADFQLSLSTSPRTTHRGLVPQPKWPQLASLGATRGTRPR